MNSTACSLSAIGQACCRDCDRVSECKFSNLRFLAFWSGVGCWSLGSIGAGICLAFGAKDVAVCTAGLCGFFSLPFWGVGGLTYSCMEGRVSVVVAPSQETMDSPARV